MKASVLTETANVIEARNNINSLINRPVTEIAGLGLIHGKPGLGKSRFIERYAYRNDHILIRMAATSNNKSFLISLRDSLCFKLNTSPQRIHCTVNELFNECLGLIDELPNTIIFIDEIDYAFRKRDLLGTIRDVVDQTTAVIILVGMESARRQLLLTNPHFFDRCYYFCEFKKLELDDIQKVCKEVLSITIDDTLMSSLEIETKGNFRRIIKALYSMEEIAKTKDLTHLTVEDYVS